MWLDFVDNAGTMGSCNVNKDHSPLIKADCITSEFGELHQEVYLACTAPSDPFYCDDADAS